MSKQSGTGGYGLFALMTKISIWFGDVQAMTALGALYESGRVAGKSVVDAHELYKKAANKGDVNAMVALATNYTGAKAGIAADPKQVVHWLEQAHEQGSGAASWMLGKFHLRGRFAEQDTQAGLKYLEEAALRGHKQACADLGKIYQEGQFGVIPDQSIAQRWFDLSADQSAESATPAAEIEA